jgi:CRP-like cAMP-binding protein
MATVVDDNKKLFLELFEGFSQSELETIAENLEVLKKLKGKTFFSEEDTKGKGFYIIVRGSVYLIKNSSTGEVVIEDILGTGDVFGWLKGKSFYTAKAIEDTIALYLSAENYKRLVPKIPRLGIFISEKLLERLKDSYNAFEIATTGRVESKIARFLLKLAKKFGKRTPEGYVSIYLPITRQNIANAVGTRTETVIRIIGNWKKMGMLDTQRGYFLIKDLNFLEDIAFAS